MYQKTGSKDEDKIILPKDSHYRTLGVEPTASQEEIKSEFFKLSKIYHPDVNSNEESLEKFQKIAAAYSIIGDVKSRDEYDRKILGIKRVIVAEGPLGPSTRIYVDGDDDDYTDNIYRRKQNVSKPQRVQWVPPTMKEDDEYFDPMDHILKDKADIEESINKQRQRVILQKIKLKEKLDPKISGTFDQKAFNEQRFNDPGHDFDPNEYFTGLYEATDGRNTGFDVFTSGSSPRIQHNYIDGYSNLYEDSDGRQAKENEQFQLWIVGLSIPVIAILLYKIFTGNYLAEGLDKGEVMMMGKDGRKLDGFPVVVVNK